MALTNDYVDVATRLAEFRAKHPEGALQPADPTHPFQVVEVAGKTFVAYTAAAYRTPDDPRPGIACAWEPFPGPTNFTRDSELQNAETSAWGRAIMAALAADARKGILSANEFRNRQATPAPLSEPHLEYATRQQVKSIKDATKQLSPEQRSDLVDGHTVYGVELVKDGGIVVSREQAETVLTSLGALLATGTQEPVENVVAIAAGGEPF